jgi:hypothetical protein
MVWQLQHLGQESRALKAPDPSRGAGVAGPWRGKSGSEGPDTVRRLGILRTLIH